MIFSTQYIFLSLLFIHFIAFSFAYQKILLRNYRGRIYSLFNKGQGIEICKFVWGSTRSSKLGYLHGSRFNRSKFYFTSTWQNLFFKTQDMLNLNYSFRIININITYNLWLIHSRHVLVQNVVICLKSIYQVSFWIVKDIP